MRKILSISALCVTALQIQAQSPGPFYQAKAEIERMLNGEIPLSYERAVFLTENAYWGNRVDEQSYTSVLDYHTLNILMLAETNRDTTRTYKPTLIKTIRQQQEDYNHLLLNWAIYTYMTDTTAILWQGDTIHHYPMLYSHSDPMGVLSWENTQVLGLLDNQNTRGNCYAMASLFYIFSRRLHTNAAISTAPGHIFIVHPDETGRTYNIDLPTRRFPGNGSMEVFTNTTEQALKSGLSMRRLDEKQAVALTLVYLAKAWQQRFGEWNNDFILDCADLCLGHDSLNLNALLVKAELLEAKVLSKNKSILDLQTDPDFLQYETLIARLYDLGYREMSLDAKNKVIFMLQRDTVGHFTSRDHTPDLGTGIPYATLSHGLFDEMHYDQPQEKYGRTILDTKTRKIVTFTCKDSLYNHYPMDLSLFGWSVDPMAYQRVSWTPYNAMRNNPIMNIDPTGALDGWVEDAETKTLQFDPNIHSQADIDKHGQGNRFKYVGETYTEKTERGTAQYRSDGSILYSSRTDGYNRIWNNSNVTLKGYREQREHLGFATEDGFLVLPDYKNDQGNSFTTEYGYSLENSKLYDPITKKNLYYRFSVHSHPDPHRDATPSIKDQQNSINQIGKPILVLAFDNQLYGAIGNGNRTVTTLFPRDFGDRSRDDLLNGKFDFNFK